METLAERFKPFAEEIERIAVEANKTPKTVKADDDLDPIGVVVKDAKAMLKRAKAAKATEKEPFLTGGKTVDAFFAVMADRLDLIIASLEDRATIYQRAKAAEERRKAEDAARKAREAEEAARLKADKAAEEGRTATAARAEAKAGTAADRAAEADRRAEASAADLSRSRGASGTLASAKTLKKVRIVDLAAVTKSCGPLGPYITSEMIQKAANTWLRRTNGLETIAGLEVFDDVKATFR